MFEEKKLYEAKLRMELRDAERKRHHLHSRIRELQTRARSDLLRKLASLDEAKARAEEQLAELQRSGALLWTKHRAPTATTIDELEAAIRQATSESL